MVYTRFHWVSRLYGWIARGRSGPPELVLPPLIVPRRPLRERRVGVLTSGGVHLATDEPFDMANPDGDASFRLIPGAIPTSRLMITHDYYDHTAADRDVNCVFPLDRLRELAAEGAVGSVAPRHVGFMGHLLGPERRRLVDETAAAMAAVFVEDEVDLVLATPG